MSNKSVPVFPSPGGVYDGLSKREYFAAHAPEMPKWFSDVHYHSGTDGKLSQLAQWRWAYADAMIAGRGE